MGGTLDDVSTQLLDVHGGARRCASIAPAAPRQDNWPHGRSRSWCRSPRAARPTSIGRLLAQHMQAKYNIPVRD